MRTPHMTTIARVDRLPPRRKVPAGSFVPGRLAAELTSHAAATTGRTRSYCAKSELCQVRTVPSPYCAESVRTGIGVTVRQTLFGAPSLRAGWFNQESSVESPSSLRTAFCWS